jgi:hypothetical protein
MDIKTLESFKLSDAVKFHDHLNPKLWVGGHLQPEVKKQLIVIAEDFMEELGIDGLDVKDITVSGSNAAYSYTPHSDLDLHILVDMSDFSDDSVYRELFNAKKTIYNDSHDITVHGVPIELYVQDSNLPVVSLGEYSLKNNKWLRIPTKRRANFDQTASKSKYEKMLKLIDMTLKTQDLNKVLNVLKTIRRYRQAGLDKGGEFSPENLAYKALRSKGYITKLYDMRDKLHSKKLSIEGMYANEGKTFFKRKKTEEDYDPNGPPPGPEFKPTMPAGTVRVNVSDVYDWYKLGQNISNLERIDLETLGTGPPSTIMAFGSEPEEHKYINDLQNLGLDTIDIDPVDPKQPKGMKRQKVDPTYNVNEAVDIQTLDTNFKHQMKFGRYIYIATGTKGANTYRSKGYDSGEDSPGLSIEVFDPYNITKNPIAHARFIAHRDKSGEHWLESDMTRVEPDYRGQNIAYQIYAYAKMLGNDIKKSTDTDGELNQTKLGKKMWRSWGKDNLNLYPDSWGNLIKEIDAKHPMKEASGYIPSEKEKNDPRFKTALTVDIKPDSIKKNAKAFYWKTSRAGIPPAADPSGKI